MRAGADDRAVADVVAVVPGAQAEDALEQALLDAAVGRQDPGDVLEAADRGVDRRLQLGDLPLVLDQLELGDHPGQLAVAAAGAGRARRPGRPGRRWGRGRAAPGCGPAREPASAGPSSP